MTSRLFILAGEASGDVLAAQLMHAVGKVKGPVAWSGMGGPHMKEAGLTSSEEMDQLSIICLLYTSPSPRDRTRSRMPSSA